MIQGGVGSVTVVTTPAQALITKHVMDVSQSAMWHQLQIIGAKIDKWQFVAEYDDLPTTVWLLWNHHNLARTSHLFREFIHGAISEGETYVRMLMDIVPTGVGVDFNLKEWVAEVVELLSKVHQAIAALKVRLEMVETGKANKYPKILCPEHLDF
jgi:hypothetical protein